MDENVYLLKPYVYIKEIPGKNIRLAFIHALNLWFNLPNDKMAVIIHVIDMLHNSSLLIDDIEDNSELRRGVPVAHKVYGVAMTINTANYMYFKALEVIVETNNLAAVQCFTKEMNQLHQGQGMDIYFRDNLICPSEDEYRVMVCKKTGGLFRLAYGLMKAFSVQPSDPSILELVENIGLYFQILDDYLNLKSGDYHDKKTFCEDLTEGKFSFPIVHSIRSDDRRDSDHRDSDRRLIDILKLKPTDVMTKQQALKLIESTGSFEYTVKKLNDLHHAINNDIDRLGHNTLLKELMKKCHGMLKMTSKL